MSLFKRKLELVVIRDVYDPSNNLEYYNGNDIEDLLRAAFGDSGLPSGVTLYHNSLTNELKVENKDDVDAILKLNGRIYAVVKPQGFFVLAAIFVSVTVAVAVSFMMPKPVLAVANSSGSGGNAAPSPNNSLAQRTNKQRLGARVPDIYGEVLSVPDLISQTYSVYIKHKEVEMSYYCIGRGLYNIKQVFDGSSPIDEVLGSSVMIYEPNQSIFERAQKQYGSDLTAEESSFSKYSTKRYSAVNGQTIVSSEDTLRIPLAFTREGISGVQWVGGLDFKDVGFTEYFKVGDFVYIDNASGVKNNPNDKRWFNFNGRYEIQSLNDTHITFKDPIAVNRAYYDAFYPINMNTYTYWRGDDYALISGDGEPIWQGWYYLSSTEHDSAFFNIIAQNGLYRTTEGNQWLPLKIKGTVESELIDENNIPIEGTLYSQPFSITAPDAENLVFVKKTGDYEEAATPSTNEKFRKTAAKTIFIENPLYIKGARVRVRIKRNSTQVFVTNSSASDEIKVKDLYGARKITVADMPKGVTTVYAKTLATEGALAVKERELKVLVERYIPDCITGEMVLSKRADDIICAIALDEKIGNLNENQVDAVQIRNEVNEIIAYFGTEKAAEFCHTFDNDNLSAEETIQIVAKAVFSQAKRQNNKVRLDFERQVPAPVAIFNSNNILPDTYLAPRQFGITNDYDGVKIEFVDPIDDAVITRYYPSGLTMNPREEKLTGVRNWEQAHFHLMRLYNKDRLTYKSCEFTAGDESNVVVRTNMIAVAEQLRPNIQQGTVESIETVGVNTVLKTTEPVKLEAGASYSMFIQTTNNGVETMAVTADTDYSVKLARLPTGEVSTDYDSAVHAVYQIVKSEDSARDLYLVAQKEPSDGMTNRLVCTNYSDGFYLNDKDFINNLIPSEV